MRMRPAVTADMDAVYMMGFDAFAEGLAVEVYLAGCRAAPKYRLGRWFVLEVEGQVVSSLICYEGQFGLAARAVGLGSVATAVTARRRGHASALIAAVVAEHRKRGDVDAFFLHSDIDPEMYRKLGFRTVHGSETCMALTAGDAVFRAGFTAPRYF